MYCDRCGNQLTLGGQYCTKCGKAILPGGAATSSATTGQVAGSTGAYAGSTGTYGASSGAYGERAGMVAGAPARASGAADGRVRRNIHRLATLWMINGILRLAWVGWMMLFDRFIPPMRIWMGPGGGPFWGWGLDGVFSRGFFSLGIVLALFGVLPGSGVGTFRARALGAVPGTGSGVPGAAAFSARHRAGDLYAVGAAAGNSGSEYDRLAQNGGHMNSAAASSH